ncbi:MAG: hypothetical protein U1E51_31510 [Candidatus Binatia bacterium]|nr:hypothetical protein [Candidatus Binatia bacterium]
MKPTTAITVIVIVLVGAFALYSSTPGETQQETPEEQANISESLVAEAPVRELSAKPDIQIDAFQGLNDEFDAILEGESDWQDDFERVKSREGATTTASN